MKHVKKVHSISFYVFLFGVITMAIVVALSAFYIIKSSYLTVQIQEYEREESFDRISRHVESIVRDVCSVVRGMNGFSRTFIEFIVEENWNQLISSFSPYLFDFVKNFGSSDFMLGIWNYWEVSGVDSGSFSRRSFSIFYSMGNIVGENATLRTTYNVELDDGRVPTDHPSYSFPVISQESTVLYDVGHHDPYAVPHEKFDYWVGYIDDTYGYTPHLSYSLGRGIIDEAFWMGNRVAANPWFGMPIASFSTYMKTFTPAKSTSWLLEVNRDFLLATSDLDDFSEIVSEEHELQSASMYKDGVVKTVSTAILGDLSLYLQEDVKKSVRVGKYQVFVNYLNRSQYDGEFLIVNAKLSSEVYKSAIVYVTLTAFVLVVFYTVVSLSWCAIAVCVKENYVRLTAMMRKVEKMQLDEAEPSKRCFPAFYEMKSLENHFLFVVEKLKEYRPFIPTQLLLCDRANSSPLKTKALARSPDRFSSDPRGKRCNSNSSDEDESFSECDSENFECNIFGDVGERIDEGSGDDSAGSPHSDEDSLDSSHYSVDHTGEGKFRLGLFTKKICVLLVEFKGYKERIKKLYSVILQRTSKEHFYEFGQDYMLCIVLNGERVRFLLAHAMELREDLKEFRFHNTRFFLAYAQGTYGNVGNCLIKKFTCGGDVHDQVFRMRRIVPNSVQFCVNEDVQKIIKQDYMTRPINVEKWFEVGLSLKVKDDEWMYVLRAKEKLKEWDAINDAVLGKYFGENSWEYNVALSILKKQVVKNPEDKIVQYWIRKVKEKIMSSMSTNSPLVKEKKRQ